MRSLLAQSALALGLACAPALCHAEVQRPRLAGRWRVEFKLSGAEDHVLQFDANAQGRGTFLLLDSASSLNAPAEPTKAEWAVPRPHQVTFSGAIEFPIGNVGRDPGTLVFKGAFDSGESISGRVEFYRVGQDAKDPGIAPAKAGDFTARRVGRGPRGRETPRR